MRKLTFVAVTCIAMTAAAALLFAGSDKSNGRWAAEEAIRATDAETLRAAQTGDIARIVSNYAEGADWLPPNAPLAHGRQAIRAGWSQLLSAPGFHIDWQITHIDVSRSLDFGYTIYHYTLTMQGSAGKPVTDDGKDLVVWRKQQDGSWKMIAESFNSNVASNPPQAQP